MRADGRVVPIAKCFLKSPMSCQQVFYLLLLLLPLEKQVPGDTHESKPTFVQCLPWSQSPEDTRSCHAVPHLTPHLATWVASPGARGHGAVVLAVCLPPCRQR